MLNKTPTPTCPSVTYMYIYTYKVVQLMNYTNVSINQRWKIVVEERILMHPYFSSSPKLVQGAETE